MVEIITFDKRGNRLDSAETPTEFSIEVARQLWNEGAETRWVAQVGFYVAGKLVRLLDRKP